MEPPGTIGYETASRNSLCWVAAVILLLGLMSHVRIARLASHMAAAAGEEERLREAEFEPEPLRVIIAGPPASGKGTQCEDIVLQYGVIHLSTGDMLRAAVKAGSELGTKAKVLMESGQLVPDDVIIGAVTERLAEGDVENSGFLLDGFPRTPAQASALSEAGVRPCSPSSLL